MAGDEMKKVRPGQRLEVPAGTYNRFVDAVRATEQRVLFRPGPRQPDSYGRIYEVTAVDKQAKTCTLRRPYADGSLDENSQLSDVFYDLDNAPSVGDRGEVLRLAEGSLYFHPGGGTPVMIRSKAHMAADNVAYSCVYLSAAGGEGCALTVRRPPGQLIRNDEVGYLGKDSAGVAVFISCHGRQDPGIGLYVETRTSDPGAETGRIWLRVD